MIWIGPTGACYLKGGEWDIYSWNSKHHVWFGNGGVPGWLNGLLASVQVQILTLIVGSCPTEVNIFLCQVSSVLRPPPHLSFISLPTSNTFLSAQCLANSYHCRILIASILQFSIKLIEWRTLITPHLLFNLSFLGTPGMEMTFWILTWRWVTASIFIHVFSVPLIQHVSLLPSRKLLILFY